MPNKMSNTKIVYALLIGLVAGWLVINQLHYSIYLFKKSANLLVIGVFVLALVGIVNSLFKK